jgi:hypothetical protein
VLVYLQPRPGDRITVLGAEAIGQIDGASVRFLLSRSVAHDDGTMVIGETFEAIDGGVVSAPDGTQSPDHTVGIAAEMTPNEPGVYEITSVRLRYAINGGAEQTGEGIDVRWMVCADDPKPEDCPVPVSS